MWQLHLGKQDAAAWHDTPSAAATLSDAVMLAHLLCAAERPKLLQPLNNACVEWLFRGSAFRQQPPTAQWSTTVSGADRNVVIVTCS